MLVPLRRWFLSAYPVLDPEWYEAESAEPFIERIGRHGFLETAESLRDPEFDLPKPRRPTRGEECNVPSWVGAQWPSIRLRPWTTPKAEPVWPTVYDKPIGPPARGCKVYDAPVGPIVHSKAAVRAHVERALLQVESAGAEELEKFKAGVLEAHAAGGLVWGAEEVLREHGYLD